MMKEILDRIRYSTPLFFKKIHRFSLVFASLQAMVIMLLQTQVVVENVGEVTMQMLRYSLTATIVASFISKLTVTKDFYENKTEDENN